MAELRNDRQETHVSKTAQDWRFDRKATPLVSVFVPTYNHEAFIGDCLEGCLRQDYPNIEIVIGDDASTDGTVEVVERYRSRYPDKIFIESNPVNVGVTMNANLTLQRCRGKYIAFSSGDDVLLDGKISKQVAFLESRQDVLILYHDVDCMDKTLEKRLYRFSDRFPMKRGSLRDLISDKSFFACNSVMMRRADVPRNGFNQAISLSSDWLFMMQSLVEKSDPQGAIDFLPEVLGIYRRHSSSVTAQSGEYGLVESVKTLDMIEPAVPQYRRLVKLARAERYITYAIRMALMGKFAMSFRYFVNGISESPLALMPVAINGFNYARCHSRILRMITKSIHPPK